MDVAFTLTEKQHVYMISLWQPYRKDTAMPNSYQFGSRDNPELEGYGGIKPTKLGWPWEWDDPPIEVDTVI